MSSSSKPTVRNVPAPPGSKSASAYTRFIPREELGDFAAWKPGSLGSTKTQSAGPAQPTEPTPDEWQARVAEVESEQKEILKVVRRLVDEGQIVLGGGGDDDFV